MPKAGVRDPEGRAIARALAGMGYGEVIDVRRGKELELTLPDKKSKRLKEEIETMCREFLANPLVEDWRIVYEEKE